MKKIRFIFYTIILFVASIFLSIGYAQILDISLSVEGNLAASGQTGIVISSIGYSSCSDIA